MARNASDEANNAILCAKNRLPATTSSSLHNTLYPGMNWNVKMQATTTVLLYIPEEGSNESLF
jgi:hypothetical protein